MNERARDRESERESKMDRIQRKKEIQMNQNR